MWYCELGNGDDWLSSPEGKNGDVHGVEDKSDEHSSDGEDEDIEFERFSGVRLSKAGLAVCKRSPAYCNNNNNTDHR